MATTKTILNNSAVILETAVSELKPIVDKWVEQGSYMRMEQDMAHALIANIARIQVISDTIKALSDVEL